MNLAAKSAELVEIALKTAQRGFDARESHESPTCLEACHEALNDILAAAVQLNTYGFGYDEDYAAIKSRFIAERLKALPRLSAKDFDRDVEITYTGIDGLDHTEHTKYSALTQRLVFLQERGAQMLSWSFE